MNRQSKKEVFIYGLHAVEIIGGCIFLWYAAADEFRGVEWISVIIGMAGLEIKQLAARDAQAFVIRERIEAAGFKWMRWALVVGLVIVLFVRLTGSGTR